MEFLIFIPAILELQQKPSSSLPTVLPLSNLSTVPNSSSNRRILHFKNFVNFLEKGFVEFKTRKFSRNFEERTKKFKRFK